MKDVKLDPKELLGVRIMDAAATTVTSKVGSKEGPDAPRISSKVGSKLGVKRGRPQPK